MFFILKLCAPFLAYTTNVLFFPSGTFRKEFLTRRFNLFLATAVAATFFETTTAIHAGESCFNTRTEKLPECLVTPFFRAF